MHSALSVKETQASSNPSARQEWWGAPAARGSSAHPNEVDGYDEDPAPRASQRSTVADETTSPRILLLIPAAERLAGPPPSERQEANDSKSGYVRAIRCLDLPGPQVPKPNQTEPRGREAAGGTQGDPGKRNGGAAGCGRDRRQGRHPCSTSQRPKTNWSPGKKAQSDF